MWLIVAGVLGALSVLLGAFGAHVLGDLLTESAMGTYQTAVRYQMYHSIFLLGVGILERVSSENLRKLGYAGWSTFIGTLLFSGSLYLVAGTGITLFGALAPVGGVFLVTGWFALVWFAKDS